MEENPIKRRFRSALTYYCDKKWKRKQKALAAACGVSDATISEIKNGNNAASPELQMKIVDIMGCSLDEFLAIGESISGSAIECTLSKPCVTEPCHHPTITIDKQNFDEPLRITECEHLVFTPWHGLVDFQPLGGINRLRLGVYNASAKFRAQTREPSGFPPIVPPK